MKLHVVSGFGLAALWLAGCAHGARVNSVNVAEAGTHVVSTPGALTIVQQGASAARSCTLRVEGHAKGNHDAHPPPGKPARPGQPGMGGIGGMRGMGGMRGGMPGGHAGPPGGGPGAMLDVLLFRLCEARANNDLSADQYAASVQTILKTMSEMAEHRPPPPPPGMRGAGPGGRDWDRGDRDRRDRRDRDRDDDRDERGGRRHDGPRAPDGPPGGPPAKDDKPKGR